MQNLKDLSFSVCWETTLTLPLVISLATCLCTLGSPLTMLYDVLHLRNKYTLCYKHIVDINLKIFLQFCFKVRAERCHWRLENFLLKRDVFFPQWFDFLHFQKMLIFFCKIRFDRKRISVILMLEHIRNLCHYVFKLSLFTVNGKLSFI